MYVSGSSSIYQSYQIILIENTVFDISKYSNKYIPKTINLLLQFDQLHLVKHSTEGVFHPHGYNFTNYYFLI